jgi:prepilin peptidase CpaA
MMSQVAFIAAACVALACLIWAAGTDITRRIIPNRLVIVIMAAGLILRVLNGSRLLWASILIGILAIALLGLLASRMVFGWGDVKLVAAVTLLFPPELALSLLLNIALAGGLLACLYLVLRAMLPGHPHPRRSAAYRHSLARVLAAECSRIRANQPMPYGVAILGGVTYQATREIVRCWPATFC